MAENARSIASGRHAGAGRLARVDERLSAATLDLDGLTQAIYQALDQTEAELEGAGHRHAQLCAGHTGDGSACTPCRRAPPPHRPRQPSPPTGCA